MRIGTTELILILALALLILGPTVLPKMGKAMGRTIANFKKGVECGEDDEEESCNVKSSADDSENEEEPSAKKTKSTKKASRKADK